jgi:hypothetical protein
MNTKKYKVWLHLEEIIIDEDGQEQDYISADEIVLPLPVGVYETWQEAETFMEQLHQQFYEKN